MKTTKKINDNTKQDLKKLIGKGKFTYDYKYDLLIFKMQNRDYLKSVKFQNFILDIDTENFVTGIRILDASKVFGTAKYILSCIKKVDFEAKEEGKVITIRLHFMCVFRNRSIPFGKENFTQQFTTPFNGSLHGPSKISAVA